MNTGIDFFDRQEPQGGSMWLIVSAAGGGKSTAMQNLCLWLTKGERARGNTARSLYWECEMGRLGWERKMASIDPEWRALNIEHDSSVWPTSVHPGPSLEYRVAEAGLLMVDQLDVYVGSVYDLARLDEHLMKLRYIATRNQCFVVVTLSVPYSESLATAQVSSILHSFRSPYWLEIPDAVFLSTSHLRNKTQPELALRVLKGIDGIDRASWGRFEVRPEGPLVPIL